jgi:pimeloyl-ACP methyl ester carboxylesterase/class 3 adenylate cyclase
VSFAPKTQFARRDDAHLAYHVFGNGPPDILYINGFASHLEQLWQWPLVVRANELLARLGRVATYDWRGYGMSDRLPERGYAIDEFAADALAVADAAGFEQPIVIGDGPGAAVAVWLAVHHPERVSGLILSDGSACMRARPGYTIGMTDDAVARSRTLFDSIWGTGATIAFIATSLADDERHREDWARYERIAATPSSFLAALDAQMEFDVRALLPRISVPTLVAHSATNQLIRVEHGRYLATHIPGARYVETSHDAFLAWSTSDIGGDISEFVTGNRTRAHVDRALEVVLFADIVGSTDRAAAVGNNAWRDELTAFRSIVRSALDRYGAREVNTRGDDFFAVIASPSVAIEIARLIRSEAAGLRLEVRSGLHLGEVEHQGNDVTGLTVHIGARVQALAEPSEILVSHSVHDALIGSNVQWTSRGEHHLKGVPGQWRLFAVET